MWCKNGFPINAPIIFPTSNQNTIPYKNINKPAIATTKYVFLIQIIYKNIYLGSGSIIFLLARAAGVHFDFSIAIK